MINVLFCVLYCFFKPHLFLIFIELLSFKILLIIVRKCQSIFIKELVIEVYMKNKSKTQKHGFKSIYPILCMIKAIVF